MTDFKSIPSQFDDIPEGHPIVFISYSWDSEEHKNWVKKLSDDLRTKYSVYTLLDRYNRGGYDLITFMTRAVEVADRVLLIGTPEYRNKSEKYDSGGVKYEDQLISVELYHKMGSSKFIPVLRSGKFDTSFRSIVETRAGYDMREDGDYDKELKLLAADLWNNPLNAAPTLGPRPAFASSTGVESNSVKETIFISKEQFVPEIKRLLSTPNSEIAYTETIETECQNAFDLIMSHANYDFSIDSAVFKQYLDYHLSAINKLVAASIIIVRFGTLKQQELLVNAMVKLCMKPFVDGEQSVVGTSNLHLLAASLLFHAVGLSCIKFGYFQVLPVMMKRIVPAAHALSTSHPYSLPHLAGTNHWSREVLNMYMDASWYYPYSELISRTLHPFFKECFLNDEEFKDCFATWESLFSLMYVYYKCALLPDWESFPIGLFLSERYFRLSLIGGRDFYSDFYMSAAKEKEKWEPIKQGLFDGEYSQFERVLSEAKDYFKHNRHF